MEYFVHNQGEEGEIMQRCGIPLFKITDEGQTMISRALVVDDEEIVRRLLEMVLVKNGFEVIEAADGEQAIDILCDDLDFSLIITDLHMGKINGIEVVKKAKELNCEAILFLITASRDDSYKTAAFDSGADEYLQKPFSIVELADLIRSHQLKREAIPAVNRKADREGPGVYLSE